MSAFLLALLICTLTGTAMGLIVTAFARANAAGPRWVRAAYALVALALLTPWRPQLAASTVPRPLAPVTVDIAALRARLDAVDEPTLPPQPARATAPVKRGPSPAQVVFAAWLTGACLLLGEAAWRHACFLRLARRWRRRDPAVEARLLALDGRRAVPVYRSPLVAAPMLAGLLQPKLYLPEQGEPSADVLRHELAHLRSGDLLLRAAWLLARAVHWFNPCVWLLERGCVLACEAAADARALRHHSGKERRAYAETVLDSAVSRPLTPLTMQLNGGKRMMKRRLTLILREHGGRLGALMLALALLIGLCAPLTRAETSPAVTLGSNTFAGTRLDPVVNGLHMGASLDDLVALAEERGWELWQDGANVLAMATYARESAWYTFVYGIHSLQLMVLYRSEAEAREAAQALVQALEPLYGPYDKVMQNPYDARWEEESASSRVRIRPNEDISSGAWWAVFEYTGVPEERLDENNVIKPVTSRQLYPDYETEPAAVFNVDEETVALLSEVIDSFLAGYGLSGDAPESEAQAALADARAKRCATALEEAAGENRERFWLQFASLELIPAADKLMQAEAGTARGAIAREFLVDFYRETFGEEPTDLEGWLADEVGIIEAYYGA